jgi:hypothetical protein
MEDLWDTIKRPNLQIMGIEEGEKIQTKGINNLVSKIIEENSNLQKSEGHPVTEGFQNSQETRNTPRYIHYN